MSLDNHHYNLDDECFFIAPIGPEDSEIRERSDGVLDYIVAPAALELGLRTVRADKIARPGLITRHVIEHVVGARAAVVDLTGANPNVYYEMAVRHTLQLPTVLIAEAGELLPFDIAQMRTVFFEHTSLKSAATCREQIREHLQEALAGSVESPIDVSVSVQRLGKGSPQDQALAQMLDGIDTIRARLEEADVVVPRGGHDAVRDLATAVMALAEWRSSVDLTDRHLDQVLHDLEHPVRSLLGERAFRGFVSRWRGRSHAPSVIVVDLTQVDEPLSTQHRRFSIDAKTTVADFLDEVYYSLEGAVSAYSYLREWVLTHEELGQLDSMGTSWANGGVGRGRERDTRLLAEVGVGPGDLLKVVLLDPAEGTS